MMYRAMCLAVILVAGACTTPAVTPSKTPADTQDTQVVLQETGTGPVETGWPVLSGEDLAMVDADARTVEMRFNTDQELDASPTMTWTIPMGDATVLLCDFDGDGLDDAWVMNTTEGDLKLSIYRNTSGDFADTATYTVSPGFSAANYSYGCGDLRGTGHADFVAFKKEAQKLSFYPNTGSAIDVEGMVKSEVSVSSNTSWLIDDFDGDGKAELGALSGGTLTVWPMTDGVPQTSSALLTATVPEGYKATTLDLDADSLADLAIWNGAAFVVWPGTGSGFDTSAASAFVIDGNGKPVGGNLR